MPALSSINSPAAFNLENIREFLSVDNCSGPFPNAFRLTGISVFVISFVIVMSCSFVLAR